MIYVVGDVHGCLPELEYVESLPAIISPDDAAVIYGGINHRNGLTDHSVDELLNVRSLAPEGGYERPFWFETRRESPACVLRPHRPLGATGNRAGGRAG